MNVQNKSRQKRRRLLTLAGLLLSWPFVSWAAAKLLIVRAPLEHAEAIVLLSGSSTLRERALRTSELFREGRAPKIILTNDGFRGSWSNAEQRNPSYYEATVAELTRLGVPRDKIEILPTQVSSTYDEAVLLRQHAQGQNLSAILVVTSPYHSRRALWVFRRVFRDSGKQIGMEPASTGWQTPSPANWWLKRRGWQSVPIEYLKMVYYAIRYH